MEKLSVELENCYGIRKLKHKFDFSAQRKAYAIYAPNGSMKSSLAATFKDISDDKKPVDRIFPSRVSVCNIKDENGALLPKESVLVLQPYDEFFSHSEKTSTLLVNNKLRQEFEKLNQDLENSKEIFLEAIRAQSGSKKDLDREISLTFMASTKGDSFYQALIRVKEELKDQKDAPFSEVVYDIIFDHECPAVTTTVVIGCNLVVSKA